jgi:type IV pilus assembly protein PilB
MNLRDLPLGSLIVRDGIVRAADVRDALVEAQDTDRRLGEVLLARGWIRERDLGRLLAQQEGLDFVDLGMVDLDERAVDCLPETVARANVAVAYGFAAKVLLVAIEDPTDEPAMDAVRAAVDRRVRFVVATASEIAAAQRDAFGEPFSAATEQLA